MKNNDDRQIQRIQRAPNPNVVILNEAHDEQIIYQGDDYIQEEIL